MIPGKVLVVDDARAVIELLSKALQRLGVPARNILTASNPNDAIAIFTEHEPAVVFMDMDLAGQPGDQAALTILDAVPSTKVIIVTGLDPDLPRVRNVVSGGAYAVIEKPVRLARLREVMDLVEAEDKGLRRVQ